MTDELRSVTTESVKHQAHAAGFDLCGVAPAAELPELPYLSTWLQEGYAAEMAYMHRSAERRADVRQVLPSARAVIVLGTIYNVSRPYSTENSDRRQAAIARYAWGDDYHDVLRAGLLRATALLKQRFGDFESRICVDTAPLLERSYARAAGLGWIGRNTCLINQHYGSWFFLGELLLSLPVSPDTPAPDRCGSCRRCIDACPTNALVPDENGGWTLDSRHCISYFTIEQRGGLNPDSQSAVGRHIFGCDICQDVCPWNRRRRAIVNAAAEPHFVAPSLEKLALLTPEEFRTLFRHTPIWRTKYQGFLRNVAMAMGNSGSEDFIPVLLRLCSHSDAVVAATARASLDRLQSRLAVEPPAL